MKKDIENWLLSSEYDLETAEHMFSSRRYIYTVFMCHLALEKALKGKVLEVTQKTPPRTHDLLYLVELAKLTPTKEIEEFIVEISNLSVVTRYPSDFQRIYKDFSRQRANYILQRSKEVFKWIKKSIGK